MRCRRGNCAGASLTMLRAARAARRAVLDDQPGRADAELGRLGHRRCRRAGRPARARTRPGRTATMFAGSGGAVAAPARPVGDGRPGVAHRGRADDQPEVAGPQGELVDLGARRGAADGAHRVGMADRVGRADDGQDRHVDVGQGDQPVVDDEAALEHPVVQEVHLEELRDAPARTRPSSPRSRGSGAASRAAAARRGRAASSGT